MGDFDLAPGDGLDLMQRWCAPLFDSSGCSVFANIIESLGSWLKELVTASFAQSCKDALDARLTNQDAWLVLCKSLRVDPQKACGFPVSMKFLPNVHNKPAMTALSDVCKHVESAVFTRAFEMAIGQSIKLRTMRAAVFELYKRSDILCMLFSRAYTFLITGLAHEKLHCAPEQTLMKVADAVGRLHREMQAMEKFVAGANRQYSEVSKKKDNESKEVTSDMEEAFKFWAGLQENFKELNSSVVEDLLEGQAANMKLQLPASWKADLSENPTPATVERFMQDPKMKEQVIAVARVTVHSELLSKALSEIGTLETTLESERKDWNKKLAENRMFTCCWSLWSLSSAKSPSQRQRQGQVAAKKSKLGSELQGAALSDRLKTLSSMWVETGNAFSKA